AATAVGALAPGDAMDRTVLLAVALIGLPQLDKLARWDPDLLDGARLGRLLVDDLLAGWGAAPGPLAAAHVLVDGLARRMPLARPVDDETAAATLAALAGDLVGAALLAPPDLDQPTTGPEPAAAPTRPTRPARRSGGAR
ncbi:MAG: hypothetical protein ACO1PW_09060, partial [Actinomycetota bacterium]